MGGGIGGPELPPLVVVPPEPQVARAEVEKLLDAQKVTADRVKREHRVRHSGGDSDSVGGGFVVAPVNGVITSNYGPRWGTTHYGLDIANSIGTPVRSPMDGVVLDAGPASGFGLWVRIQHDDGTVTVYGHINSFSVREGQRIRGGDVIAEVGNRGISTGPHLHFEVWAPGGAKVDPLAWLEERGAHVG